MKYFEKTAKILDLSDVEEDLGTYLPDKEEEIVRQMIRDQYNKRFALRHPILTGIPTLGLAPTISKDNAIEEIRRPILKKNNRLNNIYRAEKARRAEMLMREFEERGRNQRFGLGLAAATAAADRFGNNQNNRY